MTVALQSLPQGTSTNITLQSIGVDLTPKMGGPIQRATFAGAERWTLEVQCQPMKYAQAVSFVADLIQGLNTKVTCPITQPGLTIGSPGTPLVNGANQSGRTLIADGFSANYAVQKGQFFSLVSGGVRYLHQITTAVTANSSGQVTLSFYPMLKVTPADNDVLEFASPKIEGFLEGNSQTWNVGLVNNVGVSFRIQEAGG